MISRELLHQIVERLPESELLTAVRLLTALGKPANPVQIALANAPLDDEPDDDDFDGGLTEARSATEFISHEELVRRLFDEP